MSSAVVFSGGPHPFVGNPSESCQVAQRDKFNEVVVAADYVVAADSGLHLALACGRMPDLVIGDMDSVNPSLLEQARGGGAEIRSFPQDKDATDLELAVETVNSSVEPKFDSVTVIGSQAGRVDHLLSGMLLLGSERFSGLRIDAWFGDTYIAIVRDSRKILAETGQFVSVMALNATAQGVRSTGLRWAFHGEELSPGSTRGVSNEFVEAIAAISLDQGCLAVIIDRERRS
jgi:thiamine pyrophosphokinase